MISYKDKTFCGSKVERHTCGREFTKFDLESAINWWGGEDPPVAFSNFCEEEKLTPLEETK